MSTMRSSSLRLIICIAILSLACNGGVRSGSDLSSEEIEHIRDLGILDTNEVILVIHSQSGNIRNPFLQAGNFVSDKRIASYWIDPDSSETSVIAAYHSSIDTLTTHYNNGWPAGNYIKVDLVGPNWFNVYVNNDKEHARAFYEAALAAWRKQRGI